MTASMVKCCVCGAESSPAQKTCEQCGSGKLLDHRRYGRRALAVSLLFVAIALLVAAMIYGELHRMGGAVAIGI